MTRPFPGHAAGVLLLALVSFPLWAQEKPPTPGDALERLKAGNLRFEADQPSKRDVGSKRRAELAKGQRPFAVILTCADSRVAPELIFDQGLGDVFVLRVAGNVTDTDLVGSIEFAVGELKVPLVVVLGHTECGAVKAALEGKPLPGELGTLIQQIRVGKDLPTDRQEALDAAIRANVLHQSAELTRRSQPLREWAASGRVRIVGGVYSLQTGRVHWLDLPIRPEPKGP